MKKPANIDEAVTEQQRAMMLDYSNGIVRSVLAFLEAGVPPHATFVAVGICFTAVRRILAADGTPWNKLNPNERTALLSVLDLMRSVVDGTATDESIGSAGQDMIKRHVRGKHDA